jgi:hypothetical protein
MRVIHSVLDDIHTLAKEVERSTRRKKRIQREHIVGALHVARILANGAAVAMPKVAPVAVVIGGLVDAVTKKKEIPDDTRND